VSRPFRLYVCSDIHAAEGVWRKLLNATRANVYKADAVLIAGDLTGKALVPVVERRLPLVTAANREQDIRDAVAFADRAKINIVIAGGAGTVT